MEDTVNAIYIKNTNCLKCSLVKILETQGSSLASGAIFTISEIFDNIKAGESMTLKIKILPKHYKIDFGQKLHFF